jgi:hypothetical protein
MSENKAFYDMQGLLRTYSNPDPHEVSMSWEVIIFVEEKNWKYQKYYFKKVYQYNKW